MFAFFNQTVPIINLCNYPPDKSLICLYNIEVNSSCLITNYKRSF